MSLKGLWQGILSPVIFVIVMEALTKMLTKGKGALAGSIMRNVDTDSLVVTQYSSPIC